MPLQPNETGAGAYPSLFLPASSLRRAERDQRAAAVASQHDLLLQSGNSDYEIRRAAVRLVDVHLQTALRQTCDVVALHLCERIVDSIVCGEDFAGMGAVDVHPIGRWLRTRVKRQSKLFCDRLAYDRRGDTSVMLGDFA